MRITETILAMTAFLFVFPALGQEEMLAEIYNDQALFESGGGSAGGSICMHVTSVVGSVPLLWDFEPNYSDLISHEVWVEILSDGYENRVVQAAGVAMEKYGFIRSGEYVYELPGSSLCFLKMYRSESPKLISFIPFFQNPLDRCDAVFTTRYDPIAFEQTLNEEFDQFGLTGYIKMIHSSHLFHPPPRFDVDTCD